MNRWATLAACLSLTSTAFAVDVGVSVTLGQPGFYGQINIGSDLVPRLVMPQPVIIAPQPGVVLAPIYLRVPPGHRKEWGRYCGQYGACGRQVFFVTDDWYENDFAPQYRARHSGSDHGDDHHGQGHGKGHGGGNGKGKGRGHD